MLMLLLYCIAEFMLLYRELGWWSWWWAELREGHMICEVWLCLKWHMECTRGLELAKKWNRFNRAKLDFYQLIFNADLPYQTISKHRQNWHLNTLRCFLQFLCFVQSPIPILRSLNLQIIFILRERAKVHEQVHGRVLAILVVHLGSEGVF